jgi:hypothetical protein
MKKTDCPLWNSHLNKDRSRRSNTNVSYSPPEFRDSPQNRYGRHRPKKIKVFRGSTFGPANKGRSLPANEIADHEERLRGLGLI